MYVDYVCIYATFSLCIDPWIDLGWFHILAIVGKKKKPSSNEHRDAEALKLIVSSLDI